MAKNIVGIDIGACQLKLAVCADGVPRKLVTEEVPDNMIKDGSIVSPEATAQFIKKTASKARIGTRACAVILPTPVVFTRTMTIPAMTHENLALNLPYEFRDFITQEKDKYFYDYAMLNTIPDADGKPHEFEIIAAATLKETVKAYADMCRRAGFKLVRAIPEELSYMNIVRSYEEKSGSANAREYCIIDLGHTATRLHIFKGYMLQATRVFDYGMQMLDSAIADSLNADEHIARAHKHSNTNNVLTSDICTNIYSMISIEVMRAINFYRFNSPTSNLTEVFLCGGGAKVEPMVERLASDIGMPVHRAGDLLPGDGGDSTLFCPAIGITMQ